MNFWNRPITARIIMPITTKTNGKTDQPRIKKQVSRTCRWGWSGGSRDLIKSLLASHLQGISNAVCACNLKAFEPIHVLQWLDYFWLTKLLIYLRGGCPFFQKNPQVLTFLSVYRTGTPFRALIKTCGSRRM